MEALYPFCSGIHHKHVPPSVIHHFQYMGMPADEKIGPVLVYKGAGSRIVSSGIATDMGHQDLYPFTSEKLEERIVETYIVSVAVAVHPFQRLECRDCFRHLHTSEIPGMPYLVHRIEEAAERGVENPVRV